MTDFVTTLFFSLLHLHFCQCSFIIACDSLVIGSVLCQSRVAVEWEVWI